ncbi:MAG: DUF4250 domain-containing protein [Aeromonas sp.]
MELKKHPNLDVITLLGIVNMQLRDHYADLDDLCKAQDLDKAALEAKLASCDFHYQSKNRQFK